MKNRYFIVTCAGMSGSKWLASALNKHSSISCTHSAAMYTIYNRNYTDDEIINILEIERKQFNGQISLDEVINQLDNGCKLNGNVHAYRLYRLKEAIAKADIATPVFRLANLVRHPFDVTISRAFMFEQMCKSDETVRKRLINSIKTYKKEFEEYILQYNLDCADYYVLSFMDAVLGLQKLADEVRFNPDVYHIKIEDLKNPLEYIKLVNFLSFESIETTYEEAKAIVTTPKINSHTNKNISSKKQKYTNLKEWEKKLLLAGFEKTDIIQQYKKLDYSFDFLENV